MSSSLIGQRIGNYQVTKLLAEGGMGAVYVAEHPAIGRRVAVKVLLPEVARDADVVRRFFNEARAAHAIRHPGIVEILDFGTLPDGASYIVMELLEGENLAARLRHVAPLPVATAVDFAIQAAEALGAAHARSVVHRDLKPDNLFLVRDARHPGHELVKVLDFGIAKLLPGPGGAGSFKTRTGALMGTPVYMSPEQCLGTKEVDARSDIYALGVIVFQMLTGTPPFMSEGYGELINMHISAVAPRVRTVDPRLPEHLEAAVARALAKDPAQRPQTMAEFIRLIQDPAGALRPAPAGAGGHAVSGGAPAPIPAAHAPLGGTTLSASASFIDREMAKVRGRRWRVPVLAAGVLLVAAAGAAVWLLPDAPGSPAASPSPPVGGAAAPSPPRAAPPGPAPPPAELARITVSVTSVPAGAHLIRERDRAVIGVTPFKESWPPGTGTERLRIEHSGYKPEFVAIPLDRGAAVTFTLAREPKPARPASKRPSRTPVRAVPHAEPVPL